MTKHFQKFLLFWSQIKEEFFIFQFNISVHIYFLVSVSLSLWVEFIGDTLERQEETLGREEGRVVFADVTKCCVLTSLQLKQLKPSANPRYRAVLHKVTGIISNNFSSPTNTTNALFCFGCCCATEVFLIFQVLWAIGK